MTLDLDVLHARLWLPTCSQCGAVDPPSEHGEGMDGHEFERHVGCPKPDDLFASEVGDHGLTRDEQRALLDEARRLRALLAGSTTPPSDAELADGGDLWIVTSPHSSGYRVSVLGSDEARAYRDAAKGAHVWHRWDEAIGCPMERDR